MNTKFMVLVL